MRKIAINEIGRIMERMSGAPGEAVLIEDFGVGAGAGFMRAYTALVEALGTPDFPCDDAAHWPRDLDIGAKLCAVWDFDYYQLSLTLDEEGVMLARHDA